MIDRAYRSRLVRQRGEESEVVRLYDVSHPPLGADGHRGFLPEPLDYPALPDAEQITKKDRHHDQGRLMERVDMKAARGRIGSATAADGRTHARGIPCPEEHMYLSADRRMWCPAWEYDQRKTGALLEAAFTKR